MMLTVEEIQRKIQMQPLWRMEIPMGFQLGLPLLSVEYGQLCLSFLIYRTARIAGGLEIFSPGYFATWIYPFDKIVRFADLAFQEMYVAVPGSIKLALNDPVIDLYNRIYTECEKAMEIWLAEHEEESILRYQDFLEAAVEKLKLNDIYGRGKLNVLYSGF